MILLRLLISGVCAGWSSAPQAAAFTPALSIPAPSHSLAKRGPVTSLCAFESDEEEGSIHDTSTGDIVGMSLLSGIAASVGTSLLAAVASALRNDDDRKDGTTSINSHLGTINRRKSIQNMANTALSITAGNLAFSGVMTATGGTATAALSRWEQLYEQLGSSGASGALVASKHMEPECPKALLAWFTKKKAERSFANAVAATAIVSKALSGNDEEKQPTEDEAESEEEESDTLPPVHKCKDDESPPDTDVGVQHHDEVE